MEENSDVIRKTTPSIPANYISILHLQERWINDKDRKRKEGEEKRREQHVEIEADLKKTENTRGERDDEKRLVRSHRNNWGRNRRKKEPTKGGDAKFVEKKEPEAKAAVGSDRGEDAATTEKELRGFKRKRYKSKVKKNQNMAVVEEDVVVDCSCGSIAPPPEAVVTEKITRVKDVIRVYRKEGEVAVVEDDVVVIVDNGCGSIAPPPEAVVAEKTTPVKDVIRVERKKREKAPGKKRVEYLDKTVTDDATTAIETQFENLSIKNLKAQTGSSNRNRLKQGNNLVHQRVRKPIGGAASSTMVWVKKEHKERAGDGIASGFKPLNFKV